jgi:hypothetical protein
MKPKFNVALHPELAVVIAREVNARAVACSMIDSAMMADPYVDETYQFWRQQHIEATHALAEFGIVLSTYDICQEEPKCQPT